MNKELSNWVTTKFEVAFFTSCHLSLCLAICIVIHMFGDNQHGQHVESMCRKLWLFWLSLNNKFCRYLSNITSHCGNLHILIICWRIFLKFLAFERKKKQFRNRIDIINFGFVDIKLINIDLLYTILLWDWIWSKSLNERIKMCLAFIYCNNQLR